MDDLRAKMKKHKLLIFSVSVMFIFLMGLFVGARLAIDYSVVNQLQQITMDTRTNDMFNPIIVDSTSGIMKIEVTLPNLNLIDNALDDSDMFIHLYRIENPIDSVYDWNERGIWVDEILLDGAEYDAYCDEMNPTMTHWTHFYMEWHTGIILMEGYTYALLVDFYDGEGTFHWCETVWNYIYFAGGMPPEFSIIPTRPIPAVEGLALNIVPPDAPAEATMIGILNECDHISFFGYMPSTGDATTTIIGDGGIGGAQADGWMNEYDIFDNMKNGTVLILLILLLGLFGLICFLVLFFLLRKKKGKKKKGGKKK